MNVVEEPGVLHVSFIYFVIGEGNDQLTTTRVVPVHEATTMGIALKVLKVLWLVLIVQVQVLEVEKIMDPSFKI